LNQIQRIDDKSVEVNFSITHDVEELFRNVYKLHKLTDKQFCEKIGSIIVEYVEEKLNEKHRDRS
jgi:hypothetical protein